MGNSLKIMAMIGGGVAVVVGCAWLAHQDGEAYSQESQRLTGVTYTAPVHHSVMNAPVETINAASEVVASEDQVAKWLAEAFDANPTIRATAIAALATAPRSIVVPTLQRVLIAGEPMVDRPLALNALRTLALQQGDSDGDVRDAVRQAIYDGSDDAITERAQSVLEEVEAALDRVKAGKRS